MTSKTSRILLYISLAFNVILAILLFQANNNSKQPTTIQKPSRSTSADIYVIGNSIMKPARFDILFNNKNIINQAVPGMTSTDAVMMSNQLIPKKPKKAFVMLGVNDIKSNVPPNITIRNIGHFVYSIKRFSPHTKIYLMSILPVNENFKKYKIKNTDIQKMNMIIQQFCKKFNFEYIDLYKVLLDDKGNLDKKYTTDGLHINQAAYEILAKPLEVYMR